MHAAGTHSCHLAQPLYRRRRVSQLYHSLCTRSSGPLLVQHRCGLFSRNKREPTVRAACPSVVAAASSTLAAPEQATRQSYTASGSTPSQEQEDEVVQSAMSELARSRLSMMSVLLSEEHQSQSGSHTKPVEDPSPQAPDHSQERQTGLGQVPESAVASASGDRGAEPQSLYTDRFGRVIDETEMLRRQRISMANKGKRPAWNRGRKHSEETKKKIAESTRIAMRRPEVVAKVKVSYGRKHSPETKEKIRKSLASYRAVERQIVQELVDKELDCSQPEGPLTAAASLLDAPEATGSPALSPLIAEGIAKLAPEAFEKSKLLETASAKQLADHFSLERIRRIVDTAQRVLTQASDTDSSGDEEELPVTEPAADGNSTDSAAAARIPDPDFATVPAAGAIEEQLDEQQAKKRRAMEHRASIAAAIRRKWQDPEYRARMAAGNQRRRERLRTRQPPPEPEPASELPARAAQTPPPKAPQAAKPNAASTGQQKKPRGPRGPSKQVRQRSKAVERQTMVAEELLKYETKLAKLKVAQGLVVEMEAALTQFADQDLEEVNGDLRQSIEEARELLERAKRQVEQLTKRQFGSAQDTPLSPQAGNGRSSSQAEVTNPAAMNADELDSAMLVLNMD